MSCHCTPNSTTHKYLIVVPIDIPHIKLVQMTIITSRTNERTSSHPCHVRHLGEMWLTRVQPSSPNSPERRHCQSISWCLTSRWAHVMVANYSVEALTIDQINTTCVPQWLCLPSMRHYAHLPNRTCHPLQTLTGAWKRIYDSRHVYFLFVT
jgi:hypothetical protein